MPGSRRGEPVRYFYLLLAGEVEVVDAQGKVVSTLRAGEYFGENALLERRKQRNSSLRCGSTCTCTHIAPAHTLHQHTRRTCKSTYRRGGGSRACAWYRRKRTRDMLASCQHVRGACRCKGTCEVLKLSADDFEAGLPEARHAASGPVGPSGTVGPSRTAGAAGAAGTAAAEARLLAFIQMVSPKTTRALAAGETVIVEGAAVEPAFNVLSSGRLRVSRGGVALGKVAQGECFGEMSLLAPEPAATKQFTLTCAGRFSHLRDHNTPPSFPPHTEQRNPKAAQEPQEALRRPSQRALKMRARPLSFARQVRERRVLSGDHVGCRLPPTPRKIACRQSEHAGDCKAAAPAQCAEPGGWQLRRAATLWHLWVAAGATHVRRETQRRQVVDTQRPGPRSHPCLAPNFRAMPRC